MSEKPSARLDPMDALRGIAALGVAVFSHYQHWGCPKEQYPFLAHAVASWLYAYSWLFVDLFFILSGVVLTFRYLEPLVENKLGAKEFFWLRFSRLYPLHFVTLMVCAAVEWRLMAKGQPTLIYTSNNDLYHFFLQATYLHSGWFESGLAYNMPSWSVCSEVLVYAIFFVIATKYKKSYPVACLCLFLVGLSTEAARLNYPVFNENMARAMVGFGVGSLLFLAMTWFDEAGLGLRLGLGCFAGFLVVCGLAYWIGYDQWVGGKPFTLTLVVFPLVVVSVLKVPLLAKVFSLRPLTFFGDISYAVYLLHVPIQMVTLSVAQAEHITLPVATNGFFFAWAATLVVLATAAHYGIERPAQRWLRGRLGHAEARPIRALAADSPAPGTT
jgi:peptidoglycan/LPS O-acetylase OafA/YrhL